MKELLDLLKLEGEERRCYLNEAIFGSFLCLDALIKEMNDDPLNDRIKKQIGMKAFSLQETLDEMVLIGANMDPEKDLAVVSLASLSGLFSFFSIEKCNREQGLAHVILSSDITYKLIKQGWYGMVFSFADIKGRETMLALQLINGESSDHKISASRLFLKGLKQIMEFVSFNTTSFSFAGIRSDGDVAISKSFETACSLEKAVGSFSCFQGPDLPWIRELEDRETYFTFKSRRDKKENQRQDALLREWLSSNGIPRLNCFVHILR